MITMAFEKQYAPDGRSYRYQQNGWRCLHLEGSPQERGLAHGILMAEDIFTAIQENTNLVYVQTGVDWAYFKEKAAAMWEQKMGSGTPYEEYAQELQGIVDGVNRILPAGKEKIDLADLLVWNGYEELTGYWFPTVASEYYASLGGSGKTLRQFHSGTRDHCSAFIATGAYTADGKIVVAHNTFTEFQNASYVNVVIEVVPDKGNRFIMQAQPGYIHSLSDFYVTSAGLIITETTIGGFSAYDSTKTPEFLRIRHAVQYADHLQDFVSLFLNDNNGGYANTWLVGDTKTNEIMRFECGLKFHKTDIQSDGYFVGFNAPLDPRIRNLECENSGFADIRRHQGARQVRLPQLMEEYKAKGGIDEAGAQAILADHYDVYLQKINPCSRTVCSHYYQDDRAFMSQAGRPEPYAPRGAVDGVTATAADAANLCFWGRFGSSCGTAFHAETFLQEHPQFEYLRPFLKDLPSEPWTRFPPE